MFPVAVVGNVDPQMPLERFSCQCARERDEESSLPLQMESGGPKWREFARNSPVSLKQENNFISMVYGGCAGSSLRTALRVVKFPDRENTGKFSDFGFEISQGATAFDRKF